MASNNDVSTVTSELKKVLGMEFPGLSAVASICHESISLRDRVKKLHDKLKEGYYEKLCKSTSINGARTISMPSRDALGMSKRLISATNITWYRFDDSAFISNDWLKPKPSGLDPTDELHFRRCESMLDGIVMKEAESQQQKWGVGNVFKVN